MKSSLLLPPSTIITLYVSPAQRWSYLFVGSVAGTISIMLLHTLPSLERSQVKLYLTGLTAVLIIFCLILIGHFIRAFSAVQMSIDELGLEISGGDIREKLLWKQIEIIEVRRVLSPTGKSIVDALIFTPYEGKVFRIFDQYTKSPHEILVDIRNFCNENSVHVTFNSGDRW